MVNRTEAAQVFQIIDIDAPVVDLVAALAQQVMHHVLTRAFRAARRGNGRELFRCLKLPIESIVDRIENTALDLV